MANEQSSLLNLQQIFDNMIAECNDFENNPNSMRHAINFALIAYHFREWIWHSRLKEDIDLRNVISLSLKSKDNFNTYIKSNCPFFKALRQIANSSKHCIISDMKSFKEIKSSPTWDELDCTWENAKFSWNYDGLILVTQKNEWLSLLDVFLDVKKFWVTFVNTYSLL